MGSRASAFGTSLTSTPAFSSQTIASERGRPGSALPRLWAALGSSPQDGRDPSFMRKRQRELSCEASVLRTPRLLWRPIESGTAVLSLGAPRSLSGSVGMENYFSPTLVPIVEVLVGVGCFVQWEFMRDDDRRSNLAMVN